MNRFLLDTDVLINWLRGQSWEKALLTRSDIDFYYSSVSRKELFQYKGITKKEKKKIIYLLSIFREVHITPAIAQKASLLLKKYTKKTLYAADSLIAATAWEKNLVLISHNTRHYSFVSEITLNSLQFHPPLNPLPSREGK